MAKLRVFAWLLLMDRLNTRDLMLRKQWHIDSGPACSMCVTHDLETRDHLFFTCPFAVECWSAIDVNWNINLPISSRFLDARVSFGGPCFMKIVICAAKNIWKNATIISLTSNSLPWLGGKLDSNTICFCTSLELRPPLFNL
jgi:hypothetical protein